MSWLRRSDPLRQTPPEPQPEAEAPASEALETAAPGVAALLEPVSQDGSHSVLDLGPGAPASLSLYGRFAERVRFADLPGYVTSLRGRGSISGMVEGVPSQPRHPYDLVFAWDVFDRLYTEYHAPLVARLAEVTTPDARLHVVVRASERKTARPLRFALPHTDRMRYEPTGPEQPARPQLLPAYITELVLPFQVRHGFTLKGGLREYVAVREGS